MKYRVCGSWVVLHPQSFRKMTWFWVLVLLVSAAARVRAQTPVFTSSPPPLTSHTNATFEFLLNNGSSGGADNNSCDSCAIQCKVDGSSFHDCSSRRDSFVNLPDGSHVFEVSVVSPRSSSFALYKWTIDSTPPTGSVTVDREFTNALNATLHVVLSESCTGNGGFKCSDASSCDLVIKGPGTVIPSSLKVIRPNLEYSLLLALSAGSQIGRVVVALAKEFCADAAGNKFQRGENSSVIVRFDRTPVDVNLWTGISELQVIVNKQPRTLQATKNPEDLGIFLDFSRPIVNTTEEIIQAIAINDGVLEQTERKSHGRRRFGFLLTNVTKSVITAQLQAGLQSRDGTQVLASSPVSFLYDRSRPDVTLSATRLKTRKRNVGIWIRFSEPVFLFESSGIKTSGGKLTRFDEITKSQYFVELELPGEELVSVSVPENKTTDISGNSNSASNELQVKRYTPPTLAVASSSFVTAGVLATFAASGLLSIASTSLGGAGAITSRTLSAIVSNPSGNILGMFGHLQVFALSYYASPEFPVEYSETVKGMQWLLPHVSLPWEKQEVVSEHKLHLQSPYSLEFYQQSRRRLGSNASLYGLSLTSEDYKQFFQSHQRVHPGEKYDGWHDFGKSMFWLAAIGGALVFWHLMLFYFLKWRTDSNLRGGLSPPRFEFFILILALPSICQASAFLIRGGTPGGIVLGVLLLAIPAGFTLSVFLFLLVAVILAAIVQYKEYRSPTGRRGLLPTLFGNNYIGRWVRKEGVSSSFLSKYGLLFENRKGLPRVVYVDDDYGSKWVDSEGKGIGRMKPVNSDEDSVDLTVSKAHKLLGAVRVFYIIVDLARRVTLGLVFGAHAIGDISWSELGMVVGVTSAQLLYLLVVKPYIRRGMQTVEAISLLCEIAIFSIGLGLLQHGHTPEHRRILGIIMVLLLLFSFMCQLINEWYALMEKLLKLSSSQEPNFKSGMRMLFKGLVFPFIPQRKWPKFITSQQQPRIGLVPVVHLSPSPDFQRSKVLPSGSPISFTETGGPAYDPGSPSFVDPRQSRTPSGRQQPQQQQSSGSFHKTGSWSRSVSFEGKKVRPSRSDANSTELRTLRELAKASFPGSRKDDKDGPDVKPPTSDNEYMG